VRGRRGRVQRPRHLHLPTGASLLALALRLALTVCVCPQGRLRDCQSCYAVGNGYWTGRNCSVPDLDPPCSVHGALTVRGNGDLYCKCAEGWGGETCSVSLCPVVNGQVCNGRGTCRRTSESVHVHSCQQWWQAPGDTSATGGMLACLLNGAVNWSVGGCACQHTPADWCVRAGDAGLCSGDADKYDYPRCFPSPWLNGTQGPVPALACVCTPGRSGAFCELDASLDPANNLSCSGRGEDLHDGTCRCYRNTAFSGQKGNPFTLGVGRVCEIDVTAACGVPQPGNGPLYLCNDASTTSTQLCLPRANGTYGCTCTNPALDDLKCVIPATPAPTPVPSAAPTPAPTTPAPTAANATPAPTPPPSLPPTPAPTAVPTPAPGTLLPAEQCPTCSAGVCMLLGGVPTCVCPTPSVLSYNATTGDCTDEHCPKPSTRLGVRDNQLACVCVDDNALQDTPNGPCTVLPCPVRDGRACGPVFPLDFVMDAEQRNCIHGNCHCSGFYVFDNATGTCAFRCSPDHTLALYETTCLCALGFDPQWQCRAVQCENEAFLNAERDACLTLAPTPAPSAVPTSAPTAEPSARPTPAPTAVPTRAPTEAPTSANTLLDTTQWTVVGVMSGVLMLLVTVFCITRQTRIRAGFRKLVSTAAPEGTQ